MHMQFVNSVQYRDIAQSRTPLFLAASNAAKVPNFAVTRRLKQKIIFSNSYNKRQLCEDFEALLGQDVFLVVSIDLRSSDGLCFPPNTANC